VSGRGSSLTPLSCPILSAATSHFPNSTDGDFYSFLFIPNPVYWILLILLYKLLWNLFPLLYPLANPIPMSWSSWGLIISIDVDKIQTNLSLLIFYQPDNSSQSRASIMSSFSRTWRRPLICFRSSLHSLGWAFREHSFTLDLVSDHPICHTPP
jgi:hypothetical protein